MTILKSVVAGIVVLAVVIGVAVWAGKKGSQVAGEPYGTASVTPQATPTPSPSVTVTPNPNNNMHDVTISTNYGDITFQTYDGDAPKTVENFITLAKKKFYNGVIFHRVIKGFMIQGGDPTGTGTGGPGYTIVDELTPGTESATRGYKAGTVAMANTSQPNTGGSQFFIMHQDYPLPHNYTIFGHVTKGQDVVDKIANVATDANDKPLSPVTIKSVTVTAVTK